MKLLKQAVALFILVAVLALSGPRWAFAAGPLELDLKIIKLVLPLQDLYAPYLYDVVNQQNMIGLETPFAKSGRVRFVVGAADVEGSQKALPYVGADVEVSEKYIGQRFNVGAWLAYDSELGARRGGIKGSVKLW